MAGLHIMGGTRRGQKLTRPRSGRASLGRVRQAIFNMLLAGSFGDCLVGKRVVDGFAGSGALGLEAWSNGCHSVVFIDNDRAAIPIISSNIRQLQANSDCQVIQADLSHPPSPEIIAACQSVDLLLLDPPWQTPDLASQAIQHFIATGVLAQSAVIVLEYNGRLPPSILANPSRANLRLLDHRHWGRTRVAFLGYNKVDA